MTIAFALEYIQRTMCGCDYALAFRHLVLQPTETRILQAHNQSILLIEPACDVRVESDTGVYDLSEDQTNELQYDHSGDVSIINQSIFLNYIRFIQVIPKNCKTPCQ